MIDIYGWHTGNTYRVLLGLEETGLPYKTVPVDLGAGDQTRSSFQERNAMEQVPVMVDNMGPGGTAFTLTQSIAILLYLAEKSGKLLSADLMEKMITIEALSLVMTDLVAPINFCFNLERVEGNTSATGFGQRRGDKALSALNTRLDQTDFLSGKQFGVADCAAYPMVRMIGPDKIPHLDRLQNWFDRVSARPAVQRALDVRF